ncbi:hypothetical protein DNTS_032022 [Danionella cerebrum]|uniref:Phosphatidylinositol-specific phospholipase C X domain-containing protein n=1 Tax=Danionella cerebrum TaxID=2873325 RepID=A0A553P9F6_9TELE|nr:hypothetical protein DNTS_032022 [Danionella translucida]
MIIISQTHSDCLMEYKWLMMGSEAKCISTCAPARFVLESYSSIFPVSWELPGHTWSEARDVARNNTPNRASFQISQKMVRARSPRGIHWSSITFVQSVFPEGLPRKKAASRWFYLAKAAGMSHGVAGNSPRSSRTVIFLAENKETEQVGRIHPPERSAYTLLDSRGSRSLYACSGHRTGGMIHVTIMGCTRKPPAWLVIDYSTQSLHIPGKSFVTMPAKPGALGAGLSFVITMLTVADQLKGSALKLGCDTNLVLGAKGHGATGNRLFKINAFMWTGLTVHRVPVVPVDQAQVGPGEREEVERNRRESHCKIPASAPRVLQHSPSLRADKQSEAVPQYARLVQSESAALSRINSMALTEASRASLVEFRKEVPWYFTFLRINPLKTMSWLISRVSDERNQLQGCLLTRVPSRHVAVVTAVKGDEIERERESHFFNSLHLASFQLHTMPIFIDCLATKTLNVAPPTNAAVPNTKQSAEVVSAMPCDRCDAQHNYHNGGPSVAEGPLHRPINSTLRLGSQENISSVSSSTPSGSKQRRKQARKEGSNGGSKQGSKQGRKEGGKEGRKQESKEGRKEARKQGKKEGRKKARKEASKGGRKEARKEERKQGRKEGSKKARKEGRKEESKGGRKEARKEESKERRKEARKEGRKQGSKEGRKQGRKEGRKQESKEESKEGRKETRNEGRKAGFVAYNNKSSPQEETRDRTGGGWSVSRMSLCEDDRRDPQRLLEREYLLSAPYCISSSTPTPLEVLCGAGVMDNSEAPRTAQARGTEQQQVTAWHSPDGHLTNTPGSETLPFRKASVNAEKAHYGRRRWTHFAANVVPGHRAIQRPDYDDTSTPEILNPSWMSTIPDITPLSDVTMPGTHNTMALYGGSLSECNSWSLALQLRAGIRFLDIRVRHARGSLTIHHGISYQYAHFGDVLKDIVDFLQEYPSETVLMRLKEELSDTRNIYDAVVRYIKEYAHWDLLWNRREIPVMGEARGKLIILQDFSGPDLGVRYNSLHIADDWKVSSLQPEEVERKWRSVSTHLETAAVGNRSLMFLTYSSGAGILAHPDALARRINLRLYEYLTAYRSQRKRFGIITMDFPGAKLVQSIIRFNY